jgi:GNAT superfamily N-acetyltransferase
MTTRHAPPFTVRPYDPGHREGVRVIMGYDEFARPEFARRYPRMTDYLADTMSHYTECEPESVFVAETEGRVVGALWGAPDTRSCEENYAHITRQRLVRGILSGKYGLPVWIISDLRTHLANRTTVTPGVDLTAYPAHLHIGVLAPYRRLGIGSALMAAWEGYLRERGVPGYHLYAASFHSLGVHFYQKLGLIELASFDWRFHTGTRWLTVTERLFARGLRTPA